MKAIMIISVCSVCFAATALSTGLTPAKQAKGPDFSLSLKEGKVSLRAREADLKEILTELSRRSRFDLFVYEDLDEKVTAEINNLPLEEALKRLLPNYGFLSRRSPEGVMKLRAVAVVRSGKKKGLIRNRIARIAYGNGPDQLGRINTPEVERQGPESFALGRTGDIYISDTVNGRIQIYSRDGKLKQTIAAGGRPGDIAVSESGEIFVLDEAKGRVLHYGPEGGKQADIPVSRAILSSVESFRTFRDRLLLRTRDQEEYEINPAEAGKKSSIRGPFRGIRLTPDAACTVRKVSGNAGELTITGRGEKVLDVIPVPVDRLASIVFLGRDEEMNLYLQVEQSRADGPGVDLGVIKLNPAGILLDRIEKIPNTYASWTVRLLRINDTGDIYQMMPGPEAVELNRWSSQEVK